MLSAAGNRKIQLKIAQTIGGFVIPHNKRFGSKDILKVVLQGSTMPSEI